MDGRNAEIDQVASRSMEEDDASTILESSLFYSCMSRASAFGEDGGNDGDDDDDDDKDRVAANTLSSTGASVKIDEKDSGDAKIAEYSSPPGDQQSKDEDDAPSNPSSTVGNCASARSRISSNSTALSMTPIGCLMRTSAGRKN